VHSLRLVMIGLPYSDIVEAAGQFGTICFAGDKYRRAL
jgi:hypothetical protein